MKMLYGLEQKRSGLVGQIEELRNELGLVTGALNRLDTTKKRALVSVLTVSPSEFKTPHFTSVDCENRSKYVNTTRNHGSYFFNFCS